MPTSLHHVCRRSPRNKLGSLLIDHRQKLLLPRLVAADHFLFTRLNNPRVLRAAATGNQNSDNANAEQEIAS